MHASAVLIGEPPMGAAEDRFEVRADRRNGLPGSPPSCMPRPWKEKPMHANADDLIGEPPMGAAEDSIRGRADRRNGLPGSPPSLHAPTMERKTCTQTPMISLVSLRWVRRRTGSSYASADDLIGEPPMGAAEDRFEL